MCTRDPIAQTLIDLKDNWMFPLDFWLLLKISYVAKKMFSVLIIMIILRSRANLKILNILPELKIELNTTWWQKHF